MRSSRPPAAEALVGQLVAGRYRVVQLLGSGGIGHVYLADVTTSAPPDDLSGVATPRRPRRLALKVLRAEHRDDPDLVRRFEREAAAAARVRHPNVLEVLAAPLEHDRALCFAMELLVGLDLADTLAYRRRVEPARAVRIACGAAEGLAAAHAAGVVHRDVKPENVFLVHEPDGREVVKLVDFGSAWMPGDEVAAPPSRAVSGTPEYMAPEQAHGVEAHPTADVYSLGIVLYEMLAGTVPFSGKYPEIARHHATIPPPPIRAEEPAVTPALEDVVLRAIAKDPGARFPSMDALRLALLGAVEALAPGLASPPSQGKPSQRKQGARGAGG